MANATPGRQIPGRQIPGRCHLAGGGKDADQHRQLQGAAQLMRHIHQTRDSASILRPHPPHVRGGQGRQRRAIPKDQEHPAQGHIAKTVAAHPDCASHASQPRQPAHRRKKRRGQTDALP
jgi:hypothetical protein